MALLRTVGHESRAFLWSVGFDIKQTSYEKASSLLHDHHSRKENIVAKTPRFVLVSQLAGKDYRDYLVTVELVLVMQMH